jgi:FAD/FMN-containing dehydrogenase/Fe-S oxidoreductase
MTSAQQRALLAGANCEIAFDNLTRQLYATDASIYRIEPAAVAFPRNTRQVGALVEAAMQAGVSVTARGAGTGLAGGAIGEGIVIDFSRYNRDISELDLDRKSVRVGPGVVLDNLNEFLRPHGYCFGPDVATSSRATLGGMIANNSSGAHTPAYGTTVDHVTELEVVLADAQTVRVGPGHDTLRKQRELMRDTADFHVLEIQRQMPSGLLKRWHGYGIDRCIREPDNLLPLLCGSEGTLALLISAELKISPLPSEKALVLIYFASVAEAMEATVELADLRPAAIEHLDRLLLDQTRGQREFQAARDLLDLDHRPCQSVLVVEFFDDLEDRLSALSKRRLGLRKTLLRSGPEMDLVWGLRKAGLSLLTSRKGPAKPLSGIEDTAVRPAQLPSYVDALQKLMGRLGLEASYYGHAAAGLLHVRPVLDTRSHEDIRKFRQLANEVSALVKEFQGSIAAEHGVGLARTEFMSEQLGENVLAIMREIKASFDPHNLLNPGKVVPDGRFEIDSDLRNGPGFELELPFEPVLAFAARDESFAGNLDQCNGCGGCRKESVSMCPTFLVTGEEGMSTRGRANIVRAALEGRGEAAGNGHVPNWKELDIVLGSCLSCKACTTECPSNVNMSLLKAELLHGRIQRQGLTLKQRVFSSVDVLGRVGCALPWLANAVLESWLFRRVLLNGLGLAWQRELPSYARTRFDRWFNRRQVKPNGAFSRGRVILWDDTFVRYHEPHIGMAAVKVLEAAGFEVRLVEGRGCCGRPAFSQGHLERARELGRHNIALLSCDPGNAPILFLEPSCYSMFVEDYKELKLQGAERIARRCFLFEEFIDQLLTSEADALFFQPRASKVIIHAHCHLRSLMDPSFLARLAGHLPDRAVSLLSTACCGMAGGFGMTEANYELSLKLAEPLIQKISGQPVGTVVVASGASCRHQISHLAPLRPRHMAELLADALAGATDS